MATRRPFGTIRKLSSGRYQARYSHLGRQIAADTTFATKADARAWLAQIEADRQGGVHLEPGGGRERFSSFAERWVENRNLRPRTRDTYLSQLSHILADFDRAELRQITPSDVRAWHGRLLNSGLHPNTVAKVYRLFRTILDTAVDDGLIRANPVHIRGAAVEKAVERPICEWDDVRAIAAAIDARFAALVWVAAASGLRFGELSGLTRRHVDLDARTLRVEQALAFEKGRGPTLGAPKSTAAYRTVEIPDFAVDALDAHLAAFTDDEPDALVFTSLKAKPLLNRYFSPYWRRACSAAGVRDDLRFHDLRHLAGTSAATAGASVKEIMARLGHSSPEASLRYLKVSERRDGEIADKIQARMTSELT